MTETNSAFQKPLEVALRNALSHREELDRNPVVPTASLQELRGRLGAPLGDEGQPAEEVVAQLAENVRGGIMGSAGGRFFGWVIGGSLPVRRRWLPTGSRPRGIRMRRCMGVDLRQQWLKKLWAVG
jgi:hypothetical protein